MKVTLKDKLRRYIRKQEVALSEKEMAFLDNLEFVNSVIQSHGTSDKAVDHIRAVILENEKKRLTNVQIRKSMNDAMVLFSFETREIKLYYKNWTINGLMEEIVKARNSEDLKVRATLPALYKEFRLTIGYHLPELDLQPVEDYGDVTNLLTTIPELAGLDTEKNALQFIEEFKAKIDASTDTVSFEEIKAAE